jgi:hypothetical protein
MAKSPRTREEQDEEATMDPSLFVCLEACQSFREARDVGGWSFGSGHVSVTCRALALTLRSERKIKIQQCYIQCYIQARITDGMGIIQRRSA